ncbi:hypothetical protein [Aromatoleum anaerobium]|uniref:Transmembrane protein n=1 Tax=Aromatoleum anaerobium TaxID=182180 RepID=A0ABX1PRY0_9RHOO|nr:hypothetical protein [Aromatoleum anaerobium]MCK0506437.1 hypothetical protein [Aromatoleum anaerobium]
MIAALARPQVGLRVLGALYLLLAAPPLRTSLEATMSGHMLVQIPLLAAIGFVACRLLPEQRQERLLAAGGGAVPYVVLAVFASTWWMLPRALDDALVSPTVEAAKFVSLPALVGLPLALAWRRLGPIGRGFVWTNFISMLAVLGWLYIAAPLRVCNSYLVDQQESAGWLMVKLALLLFAGWLGSLFVGGGGSPALSAAEHVAPRSAQSRDCGPERD